jgi:hypothetical protein
MEIQVTRKRCQVAQQRPYQKHRFEVYRGRNWKRTYEFDDFALAQKGNIMYLSSSWVPYDDLQALLYTHHKLEALVSSMHLLTVT